jgi:hypothetical protein
MIMVRFFTALAFFLSSIGMALPQEATPWQATVTGQIEALQNGDAEIALGLAGGAFREVYADPERFLADVKRSGYGPIVEARSYSFGSYEKTESGVVLQVVKLVGPGLDLYEAVYQLMDEPDQGWRVLGVVLRKVPGRGA